jgi:uncharacterized protein
VAKEKLISMKKLIKMLIYIFLGIAIVYLTLLVILYFVQEKIIFYPERLSSGYQYNFYGNYKEKWIETSDSSRLNALLFKSDSSKGIILYLHGNAGALNSWGGIAPIYTSLDYDILIPDYRGFGKSTGKIYSEAQMFTDVQNIYNFTKENYPENKIIIIGYSIGTGLATYLASKNHPSKLILLAPYYNFPDLVKHNYKLLPGFLLKYKLMTNEFIRKVKAPIAIFHGRNDDLIYCQSSEKLYKLCKPGDKLYLLPNQTHVGMDENSDYQMEIEKFLLK